MIRSKPLFVAFHKYSRAAYPQTSLIPGTTYCFHNCLCFKKSASS